MWIPSGWRAWVPLAGLALLLAGAGCGTVPVTGRSQFNFMSAGQEAQLGLSEFDKLKKTVPISANPQARALVERVGRRIAAVAEKDMPGAQWEFVVFESKEANAFCLPGGKVGIYTGILPITQDEAGLATVMGHEVAHAVARHGGERMSTAIGLQAVGLAVGAATAESRYAALIHQAYGMGSQLGVALPHSRMQESEADRIGLLYMARAGYRPQAAVDFWRRFGEFNRRQGGSAPWFLRTHPLDETRVRNLQQLMPEAEKAYRPNP
ncbi:MAG: M48 family metallopeptidase [Verrucomicrobiota bacterium]